jgi:hypothetical protein
MKKPTKKTEREEEVAEEASTDDLTELKKFIKKQHLQNKILKKIIEDLQSMDPEDLNKPKSA